MIEPAALLDAGEFQLFDGVGDLVQVLLREVQILGRGLQILVTEQDLDGAQVGARFQQMSRPAVANQVGGNPLADACAFSRFGAGPPHDLVGDGLLRVAMQA